MNEPKPKIVEINGPIYRANEQSARTGMTMRDVYSLDKPTFFLNNSKYLQRYIEHYKKGHLGSRNYNKTTIYPKRFDTKVDNVLRLLDMNDPVTVQWVLSHAASRETSSLRKSFVAQPNNSIKRVSTANVKNDDDVSLAAICDIIKNTGIDADGYYSRATFKENGVEVFHPEVGLCPEAFNKLIFSRIEGRVAEKELLGKRRQRPMSSPVGPMLSMQNLSGSPVPRGSLFGNLSGNNNNELVGPPNIKRRRINNNASKKLSFNNLGGNRHMRKRSKTRRRRN